MRSDKTVVLIEFLAIATTPFAIWSVLVIVARIWSKNLRPMLPWLQGLRWGTWLTGTALLLAAVVSREHFWLFPIGMSMTTVSIGLAPVMGWVKKHYAPELLASSSRDGWWPTVRK